MASIKTNFQWTDDEVELLLNVTLDFKASMAAQGVDFESVQTKYGDITALFLENYPSPEDASASGKDFPHKTEEITKVMLTAKVKALRNKFKHAMAAGRKSGYGRAVQIFYDLFKAIWGGGEVGKSGAAPDCSPLPGGMETSDLRAELISPMASDSADSGDEGRSQVQPSNSRTNSVWTDDEVELLLNVTLDYKASLAGQNVEWESVQTKYGDIMALFMENYPSPEDASSSGKDFPHTTGEITKVQVTGKVKAIRTKFKQAMVTGRKRSCGRAVFLFYDLCKAIWGGGGGGGSGAAPDACSSLPGRMEKADLRADLHGGVETADRQTADVRAELMASDSAGSEDEGRSQVQPGNTRTNLIWTDDEVELLLNVTLDYKASLAAQSVEWESVHRKYGDITDLFLENYPSPEDASASGKEFPHAADEITKAQVMSKVKDIRNKFRHAMASGRKRGCGRAVLLFYDLCNAIWGGGGEVGKSGAAPATCSPLPGGIETSDLRTDLHGGVETADHQTADVRAELMASDSAGSEDEGRSQVQPGNPSAVRRRHRHIDTSHRGVTSTASRLSPRSGHLRKKPSTPMAIAQEELDLKRRMFQHLQDTDHQFLGTMNRLTASVERISSDFHMLVRHMMGGSSRGRPQSPHWHNGLQNDAHDDLQHVTPAVVAPLFGFTHRIQGAEGDGERHPKRHARQEEASTSDVDWVPTAEARRLRTKTKHYPQDQRRPKRKSSSTTSPPKQQQQTPRQEEAPPTSDSPVDVDQVLLRLRTARKEVPEKIFAVRLGGKGGDEMAVSASPSCVSADAPEPPAKLVKQELDSTDQGEGL